MPDNATFSSAIGATFLSTPTPAYSVFFKEPASVVSPGTSLAQLKTNILAAIAAKPTGPLSIVISPASATITDTAGITFSAANGFNGSRPISIDFNGLTITGGQPTWDKPSDRLPIFVETIPSRGTSGPPVGTDFKVVIRDTRWATAPVQDQTLLGAAATSLYCQIRLGWYELRTTLVDPVRSGGITTWSMNTSVSDYLRPLWATLATQEEYTFEAGTIYASQALKVIRPEPAGVTGPAITLLGTQANPIRDLAIRGLTIRDRTLSTKEYFLDQQADAVGQGNPLTPTRWLPCTGLKATFLNGVTIDSNIFYNLDGNAFTIDPGSRNSNVLKNTFHNIGGQAISKGILYVGDSDVATVNDYGGNMVFAKNCFYRIGRSQFTGSAIFASTGALDSYIADNIIEEIAYSGIAIGYPFSDRGTGATPSYYQNQLKGIDISGNLIQKVMTTSVDGGGIYTKGPMVGGRIRENLIRRVGPTTGNVNGSSNNFYGTQVGVGSGFGAYPAPVAHLYHDNGSYGWATTRNKYGDQAYSYQPKLFLQPGSTEVGADPALVPGEVASGNNWGNPNSAPLAVPLMANGIVDRFQWFAAYGVNPEIITSPIATQSSVFRSTHPLVTIRTRTDGPFEVGTRVIINKTGRITAIGGYQKESDTTATFKLWSSTGVLLANITPTFIGIGGVMYFPITPVSVTTGTQLVLSRSVTGNPSWIDGSDLVIGNNFSNDANFTVLNNASMGGVYQNALGVFPNLAGLGWYGSTIELSVP
jgi:Domain of unknown function (DUF4082)